MSNQIFTTLITARELQQHLHDANMVIIDCRNVAAVDPANPNAARVVYKAGHIPGALHAHLDEDLSGPKNSHAGRHPLPDTRTLTTTFGRWGIDGNKQVIAYDADNGAMAAARLWWLLRWMGHTRVAVLDGGFKHWQAAGFEVSSSIFTPRPVEFKGMAQASWVSDAAEVALRSQQPDWRVLDARAPERFAGEMEPIDTVAGHVPGAVNFPLTRNMQNDGHWLPAATLRTQFAAILDDVKGPHIISMCGSGVTACHNLLALEVAGFHGAKLYAGSWSEWITDPLRPIATGTT